MAVYQFSALSDGQAISFDPNADTLNFDPTGIDAADVRATAEGTSIRISAAGKEVFLLASQLAQLTTTNVTFANGSRLIFGDNTTAQTADNSANSIVGSGGNDHLWGFGGNDTLNGGGGDDWLAGGTGQDSIIGGAGADAIVFREAASNNNFDRISGFVSGVDRLMFHEDVFGDVTLPGRIVYNSSNGYLYFDADGSGAGRAQLVAILQGAPTLAAGDIANFDDSTAGGGGGGATNGDDTLVGTSGSDNIDGQAGDDSISGLAGNDSLTGGAGNDSLDGGGDVDYFFFAGVHGNDTVDGGAGPDWLNFQRIDSAVTIDFRAGTATGASGSVSFVNIEEAIASRFDDLLIADHAGRSLFGYDGMDTVIGGAGDDILDGDGAFRDPVGPDFGQADEVFGGDGRDQLFGRGGNDTLVGGANQDTLEGGAGTDAFVLDQPAGTFHADTIRDFGSTDELWLDNEALPSLGAPGRFAPGDSRFFAAAGANSGQDASDRVVYNTSTGQLWYDADGSGPGVSGLIGVLEGAPALLASDIVVVGNGAGASIVGTSGNDTLVGTTGDDTLDGLAGNDSISGIVGNDHLLGREGDDTLVGGDGADTLEGGTGDDVYHVDYDGDFLIDAGGIDTVIAPADWSLADGFENLIVVGPPQPGSGGTIWISGNALDNLMIDQAGGFVFFFGQAGDDTLIGSDGPNFFDFGTGHGNDSVDGGGGPDELWFSTAVTVDFRDGTATSASGTINFVNIEEARGSQEGDRLIADDAGRSLRGYDGDDTVVGGAGDDGLNGGGILWDTPMEESGGDDLVLGNGGNDTLYGEAGDDTLNGGEGNDTLTGDGGPSAGLDVFIFDQPAGAANADVIMGFGYGGLRDELHLDNAAMSALGAAGRFSAGDARFFAGAGANAGQDASDRVVYNTSTGQLWYDADGAGGSAAQLVATLNGAPTVFATDIVVIGEGGGGGATEGDDSLVGTEGNDTIDGLGGNDTIDGLSGDDSLSGGDGNDVLFAGTGNDTLDGGAGNDFLNGMDPFELEFFAADLFLGGEGDDTLIGIDGATLDGGFGNDLYDVGNHRPELRDAGGVDTVMVGSIGWTLGAGFENLTQFGDFGVGGGELIGNELDNVIDARGVSNVHAEGRAGNDTLLGGDFDNLLDGGTGNDVLQGDVGLDRFVFAAAPGAGNADLVRAFTSGQDRLVLDGEAHAGIGADGSFVAGDPRFHAGAGANAGQDASDRVAYNTTTGQLWYDADGSGSGAAQLIATLEGAPALTASDIEVVNGSTGGGGTINGTEGDDSLFGTDGDDTMNGFGGDDDLMGEAGDDSISGGAGNDFLLGGEGADRLAGGDGNDSLAGYWDMPWVTHPEADTVDGGLGDDVYYVRGGSEVLLDAGGIDTVITNVDWTLAAGFENMRLDGSGLVVHGNAAANRFDYSPYWTDDELFPPVSTIFGGAGNDTFAGSWADAVFHGEDGDDVAVGDLGDSTVTGGAGRDALSGGDGNDWLEGGTGIDTVTGGAGEDSFVYRETPTNSNFDRIADFVSGTDTLRFDDAAYTTIGALGDFAADDDRFFAGAGARSGVDAEDRIVYDTSTGNLWYDADGSGGSGQLLIATVLGAPALAAGDIAII